MRRHGPRPAEARVADVDHVDVAVAVHVELPYHLVELLARELHAHVRHAVARLRGADEAARMTEAFKRVDKAAKKNIIHDNAAARTKSQLSRHVNKLEG